MRRLTIGEVLEHRHLMAGGGFAALGLHPAAPPLAAAVAAFDTPDLQTEAEHPTGSLAGYKFLDLNGNHVRDVAAGNDPHFLFVIDASGSSSRPFASTSKTNLQAEIAGITEFYQELLRRGLTNAKLAVVVFSSQAKTLDLEPVAEGTQATTTPLADADSNGLSDFLEALASVQSQGATNLEAAVDATIATLASFDAPVNDRHVIFLTDGVRSRGGEFVSRLSTLAESAGTVRVFAVGDVELTELKVLDPQAIGFATIRSLREAFGNLNRTAGIPFVEAGLPGVTVYLDSNNNGALDNGERSTVTQPDDPETAAVDETGRYVFEDLPPGDYVVREVLPANSEQTFPISGPQRVTIGSDEIGRDALGRDFGNRPLGGSIQGTVFWDFDGDGQRDANEPAFAGAKVYLDLDRDGTHDVGEPSSVSASDDPSTPGVDETGRYEFSGLVSGRYLVREVLPRGFIQSFPTVPAHDVEVGEGTVNADFAIFQPEIPTQLPVFAGPPRVFGFPAVDAPPEITRLPELGPLQPAAERFFGSAGGDISAAPELSAEQGLPSPDPWLQAVEPEVAELLPALAEVLPRGVFDPDPGDPPPLPREPPEPVTTAKPPLPMVVTPTSWSLWWWMVVPISAVVAGLWWKFGPAVWRPKAQPYSWTLRRKRGT